jgi:hypothetical protein
MAVEKRWLTKDEKRLLKPHAEHYRAMCEHIREATIQDLERLYLACLACTEVNCGWDEYAAAQYLKVEVDREVGWRNRRDADLTELVEPAAHVQGRWADDGGSLSNGERDTA